MVCSDYKDDKMIQMLACACAPFSKTDILKLSERVGQKMKSTKAFLEKYVGEGIILKKEDIYSSNAYSIAPSLWPSVMSAVAPDHLLRMAALVRFQVNHCVPEFALAVNSFLHGRYYTEFLERLPKNPGLVECNAVSGLVEVLSASKSNIPFLKELRMDYVEEFYADMLYKFCKLNFTSDELEVFEKVFLEDRTELPHPKAWLEAVISFYNGFVMHAQAETAMNNTAGSMARHSCISAYLAMQQADYNTAFRLFVEALKGTGKREFEDSLMNFYYGIALANATLPLAQTKMRMLFKEYAFGENETAAMEMLLLIARGQKEEIDAKHYLSCCDEVIDKVLVVLVCRHYKIPCPVPAKELFDKVDERGIKLLQVELSGVEPRYAGVQACSLHPSLPAYVEREKWDVKLDELLQLNAGKTRAAGGATQRIIYEVNPVNLSIQPKLQKSKDGINWSGGRNVSLEKMARCNIEGMTGADKAVAACIETFTYGWYGSSYHAIDSKKALSVLVGHPCVFDSSTGSHIDVVEEKPQLSVKLRNGRYEVRANVDTDGLSGGCSVRAEGSRIKVVRVSANVRKTIETLHGLSFPVEARDKLTRLLKLLSGDTVVMGDLLSGSGDIVSRQAHAETIVRLQPMGDAIRCQLMVRPFGDVPPVCTPGKGMQVITTTIDGKQVQTKRNLRKERENYEQVEQLMVDYENSGYEQNEWSLQPDECLRLLEQLQEKTGCARVEWPEGERLRVARSQLLPSDFRLKVNRVADWFELSGEISISPDRKMQMAELVEKAAQAKGCFVQLTEGEYVRLTAELRRHIDLLARMATIGKGGGMRLSQFGAPMLEEMAGEGVVLEADKAYTGLLARIRQAGTAEIKIPKTINADLRGYQKEGYLWMSRLALWGAGALLADDMGLGKTVQAITLLLSRAPQGPQLVVVPTAVVMNWRDELARFAPALVVKILNIQGESRETVVREAGRFDIVITTYGLLSGEEEVLTSRTWTTVVLDEAHTIKNRDTKMSQSAMKITAGFRLLLTGTPLQNHVSEMWNLMQFANPGLLGSYQDFAARFLLPIERDRDKERQRQLKRIITPFILRRTKSEVLGELPEKTEITLKVDLNPDEWAFYDNIRQKALAEIENKEATAMQALAQITRLRQAACNVRLIEDNFRIPSSKLEQFVQLVAELHANHHRALVFSQFTSHLALVRQRLDSEGIAYLYLDGSTTAKERLRLVEEFQQGDMPLFLISLKAGGLGLNLTAADYVIHLDPWWNPAIEEQASDRAYRIGQHKPVTVYRLIASGTIEEKIIDLHKTKKNMADALLEGGNISANMSREEMLDLLREAR